MFIKRNLNKFINSILLSILIFINISFSQQIPAWVTESNTHTQLLLDIMAKYNPEAAADYGLEGIDERISDLKPGFIERQMQDYNQAVKELERRLEKETIPEVKQDLQILIEAVQLQLESTRLNEQYFLPYFNLAQLFFYSLQSLLDEQIASERRPAALVRLKKYTGLIAGYRPITELAQEHIKAKLNIPNLLGPVKREIERDLDNIDRYLSGIEQLFQKFKIKDYKESHKILDEQLKAYKTFIQENILPRAREDFRLPEEVYRHNLNDFGVDMPVEELMQRAKVSFKSIQNDLNSIAIILAEENGWNTSDYREVLKILKKDQILGEDILPLYKDRIKELENIVHRENIVSLPDREMRIRLASEAESAAIPAPHMRSPRLIGNTGEMGEFVLPLKFPGADLIIDDFTHEATTWTLAVHEGRPGHEMQFTVLVEKGVSLARAIYAFNSVNVEGWALCMEREMKPYLPLKGQFGTLLSLLMRSARAFLDPGLQLGQITKEEANYILLHEVGLSEALALQEIERYTFRMPGQATSYFCGYQRMLELRADVELKLGDRFDRRTYHDFILAQGLLPPSLLRQVVFEKFITHPPTPLSFPKRGGIEKE